MSVYKRGGIYWYDFWFKGQRYRQSTGLGNKTVAFRAESICKAELAEGRAGIVNREICPAFADFVTNEFLPWSEREHQAHPRTHQRYKVSSKPLIKFFGKLRLDAITAGHVERFKVARSEGLSPAGVNRDLAALRYMMNFVFRRNGIIRNPVQGVRFLPEGPGMMRVVTHEEQERYLANASPLLRDIGTLMLETGMRPQEVFTICKENVHLERRYLFVPTGKTKFARRNVPLTDAMVPILRRRILAAKGPFLFPHRHDPNRPFTSIKKAHAEALKNARDQTTISDIRSSAHLRIAVSDGGSGSGNSQRVDGTLQHFDHDAIRPSHTRTQTTSNSKARTIQHRASVRDTRESGAVPTKVPTVKNSWRKDAGN